jgi:hypothetical protein
LSEPAQATVTKPRLSISFHNFWGSFVPERSFFARSLAERFELSIVPIGRDIQFFSVYGRVFPDEVLSSGALKVWFTGEAEDPRDLIYDLYFNFSRQPLLGARSIRLPLWATYIQWWDKDTLLSPDRLTAQRTFQKRTKFCNFIFSNPVSLRNEFFVQLNKRKAVDSFGKVLNNTGGRVANKMQTLLDYRFTIAFENFTSAGYVTEKLLEPLAAGSIPIYWGAPECRSDFNPDAFIDANRFESLDSLVDFVLKTDADDDALRALSEAPIFKNGIPYEMTPAHFADRIVEALDSPSMRGPGADINPQLAARRNLRGRIRSALRKIPLIGR